MRKVTNPLKKRVLVDLETSVSEVDEAQVLASLDKGKYCIAELTETNLSKPGPEQFRHSAMSAKNDTENPWAAAVLQLFLINPQPLIQVEHDWLNLNSFTLHPFEPTSLTFCHCLFV